jgi:hypothetical protein
VIGDGPWGIPTKYNSLSYLSSAAVRSLPKLCLVEPFREPPPVAWKQSFRDGAPKPELGCQDKYPPESQASHHRERHERCVRQRSNPSEPSGEQGVQAMSGVFCHTRPSWQGVPRPAPITSPRPWLFQGIGTLQSHPQPYRRLTTRRETSLSHPGPSHRLGAVSSRTPDRPCAGWMCANWRQLDHDQGVSLSLTWCQEPSRAHLSRVMERHNKLVIVQRY